MVNPEYGEAAPTRAKGRIDVEKSGLVATLRAIGSVDLETFPDLVRKFSPGSIGTSDIDRARVDLLRHGFVTEGNVLKYRAPRTGNYYR